MKLSKDYLNGLKGTINNLINQIGWIIGKTSLLQAIDNLYEHIETLEQELSAKPTFLITNKYLPTFGREGCIFEAVKTTNNQWIVSSVVYEGVVVHSDHVREIDINEWLKQLQQANLMHIEDVKALTLHNNKLINDVALADKVILLDATNIRKLHVRARAAEDARDEALATIERVIQDQQPVVLPKEVAETIEKVWSLNKNSNVVKHLYMTNWNQIGDDHGQNLKYKIAAYAKAFPVEYMRALVEGHTVEQTPVITIEEEVADMIHAWIKTPNKEDEAAECLGLACRVVERTKEIYSKN